MEKILYVIKDEGFYYNAEETDWFDRITRADFIEDKEMAESVLRHIKRNSGIVTDAAKVVKVTIKVEED